jgi:hypothetical protein
MSDQQPQEDRDVRLDAILDYDMDELEARAYKLCLIWLDRSRKVFPDYQHSTMKRGDPRKALIFKVCYKLVRETQGVLEEKDYGLYVRAQLDVLRHINMGKTHPLIDANCLVGEKAWKRWKLWKRKYDSLTQKPSEVPQVTAPGTAKAIAGLEDTKEFLAKTFGASPSLDKYKEAVLNRNLFRWINFGKISPYYLALSPYIAQVMGPDDLKKLNFDIGVYKPCLTDEIAAKFKEMFPHEHGEGPGDAV